MGSEWFRNMRGGSLNDEQMKDIPYPKTELVIHVTTKTIQAGGVIGALFAAPIACALRSESRNLPALQQKMTRFGRNGLIIGAALGPLMTYAATRKEEDPYKIWDRCYRLRYNRNQVRVDEMSIVGAASGAAIGVASGAVNGAVFGGVVGMVSGIMVAAVYNAKAAHD